MQYLSDQEIIDLGKEAELFIIHQREMAPLLKEHKIRVIEENAYDIASFLLEKYKKNRYLDGDVERLTKNMADMNWWNKQ